MNILDAGVSDLRLQLKLPSLFANEAKPLAIKF